MRMCHFPLLLSWEPLLGPLAVGHSLIPRDVPKHLLGIECHPLLECTLFDRTTRVPPVARQRGVLRQDVQHKLAIGDRIYIDISNSGKEMLFCKQCKAISRCTRREGAIFVFVGVLKTKQCTTHYHGYVTLGFSLSKTKWETAGEAPTVCVAARTRANCEEPCGTVSRPEVERKSLQEGQDTKISAVCDKMIQHANLREALQSEASKHTCHRHHATPSDL